MENRGLNRWGIGVHAGRPYEGILWLRAEAATPVTVAAGERRRQADLRRARLTAAGKDWQRLAFSLTPTAADPAGRFVVKLTQPGVVTLGHAFLQPGAWGRFKGLPVRRDVVEGLLDQGITVLRYGGSMVNNPAYRWKQMIGPRDRRPPYRGTWYPHSTNGWGIVDFMDLCEAAGFEYIPAFSADETPQDMADFVEYAKGSAETRWGRQRIADGHPAPYRLRYLEFGNEERVDERFAVRFEAVARAVWAKDRDVILVVGDFLYNHPIADPEKVTGAASGITSLAGQRRILRLAREMNREVWFDVHVDTEGPGLSPSVRALPSTMDALAKLADGARHRVAVFELNANNHSVRRALGNAVALHAIERDGRVPIVTSANGLQPDGQNDNGWNQGLLFLNPMKVWLQPPGHVTRMLSSNYLPRVVPCEVSGTARLDVHAKRSDDGRTLLVQVVNLDAKPLAATLRVDGYTTTDPNAQVTTLAGPLDGVNTAARPDAIAPRVSAWRHDLKDGATRYTFAPHSFTLIRFGPPVDDKRP
ncbi:MAG: alpha-L-arabinofuranosidase C-terminal domain-containing protein [Gemmataceae bacterium]